MDVAATLTAALLVAWAIVLSCAAAGAVLYYWPADFEGRTRRGFDVLPATPTLRDDLSLRRLVAQDRRPASMFFIPIS